MLRNGNRAAALLVTLSLAVVLSGCANVLVPQVDPEEPVPVYLVDHGRHASLVLPDGEGGGVRYTWGEWRWYGLNEAGALRGLQALLWPTQSALGRHAFSNWRSPRGLHTLIPEGHVEVLELEVAQQRSDALRERLDAEFRANEEQAVYNRRYNLTFVPLNGHYWLPRQSNQVMLEWLRELGLTVRGFGIYSNWRLAEN